MRCGCDWIVCGKTEFGKGGLYFDTTSARARQNARDPLRALALGRTDAHLILVCLQVINSDGCRLTRLRSVQRMNDCCSPTQICNEYIVSSQFGWSLGKIDRANLIENQFRTSRRSTSASKLPQLKTFSFLEYDFRLSDAHHKVHRYSVMIDTASLFASSHDDELARTSRLDLDAPPLLPLLFHRIDLLLECCQVVAHSVRGCLQGLC